MNKIDIVFDVARADFAVQETDVYKGENICSVQLGHLNGGPEIGIDFAQFVRGELEFSVATFKAHILNQLTILNCNVNTVTVTEGDLEGGLQIGVR